MTFYPTVVMNHFLIKYINARKVGNDYLVIRLALFSLLFVNLNYAFADDQVATNSQPQISNLSSSKINNSKDQEDGKNNDSISNNANANSNVSSSNSSDVNSNNSTNSSSSGVDDSNNTSNTNIRTEEIDNLVASMARAINSRDSSSIASFFHYYAVKDAEFIKKSYLYANNSASSAVTATNNNKDNGTGNADNTAKSDNSGTDSSGSDNADAQKPIAQEDLKMNLEQYIKYWYDISSNPADYSISISVNNIDIENPQYATATIEIREMSTQKFDKAVTSDKNQKSPDVIKEVLKVVAYSTCNMTFIYNGITAISGMNCIENIAYNIE